MISPLAVLGEAFALGVLAMGLVGFLQFYARTRYRTHLAMLFPVVLVLGSSLILFSTYPSGDAGRVATFLVVQSLGFPFFLYWGERNRRSVEQIATSGHFDPGFPLPSENLIRISFFGQIYEDLAKPVVALEGVRKLNALLKRSSNMHPIFMHASFSPKGEFVLDREIVLKLGKGKMDCDGFAILLQALIEHLASTGNIKDEEELLQAVRARTGNTVSSYLDFLVDEGLLHRLARGFLTDKMSTGMEHLDKALGGGLAQGTAVLLVGEADQERDEAVRGFIRSGIDLGEGCLAVSAFKPPETVRLDFAREGAVMPGRLKIVDCYSSRFSEVQTLQTRGDTWVSPVDLSVVHVAISRALDSLVTVRKRAAVDILTAYLVATPVDRILPELVEIVDRFRRSKCTALFVFNPSAAKESCQPVLEEVFDCVIRMRKREHSREVFLDIGKLGAEFELAAQRGGTRRWVEWSPAAASATGATDGTGTGIASFGR